MTSETKERLFAALPLVLLVAAALFAYWLSLPPSPLSASAPPDLFSAERAHAHIARVCTEPQPAGSLRNDQACEYIQGELKQLGVETELIHRYVLTGERQVSRWRAVLGRIRGVNPTKAFAVDAHFDSVPWGPGAADDWSGIAAMLEAARAIKAGPPLQNDVIFVFADQEEFNMGGAKAFRDHPWFLDVGVMLGLETRGASGPSLMFETSPANGFVVREMARSGAGARANSIAYDFYKRMPFNSDFNHYKRHTAGLNLAFINNFDRYHTVLDNPYNISLASLQHHGNYTLFLARRFGNIPLDNCYAPDATYFNTIGNHMVVHPLSWNLPLALAAFAALAATLLYGLVSARLTWRGTAVGFLLTPVAAIAAALPIGAVSYVLFIQLREAALYQNNVFSLGFVFIGLALFAAATACLRRWAQPQEFLAGALLWWALGLALFLFATPGGANLAQWPLCLGCLYLFVMLLLSPAGRPSNRALAWTALLAAPPIMFLTPMHFIAFYAVTVLASFLIVPLVLLCAAFAAPQLCLLKPSALWKTSAGLVAAGLCCLAVGWVGVQPSPKSPKLNCLAYGVNFDENRAYWLSSSERLDPWLSQYFPEGTPREKADEFLPGDRNAYLRTPAPMPPVGKPVIEVHDDRIENGRRIIACRINSPRDPQRLWLRAASDVEIYGAQILGHSLSGAAQDWAASFEILPREGADLILEVEPGKPLALSIREMTYGMPALESLSPRPAHMAPEPNRTLIRKPLQSDITYSICTIDLGEGTAL